MSSYKENQIFAHRYRLIRELGRGGFSVVWLAEDIKTQIKIAIKMYAPDKGLDDDGVGVFTKEFALVFQYNHGNLLRPTFFDVEDKIPYLILPYCQRGSTQLLIGKITENELWKIIRDVASGLAYLHHLEPPVIHQDIKPDNILIDDQGTYLITDFGISTQVRSTLRKSVQQSASIGGTTAYMGPERFSKHPAPIKASDVWSLGATIFELVTGDVPFGNIGGGMMINGAVVPEMEGNFSDHLKQTVEACLAKDPWDRPAAEQLAKYADKVLNGETPKAPWQSEVQEHPSSSQDSGRPTQRIIKQERIANEQEIEQERIVQEVQKNVVPNKKSKKNTWLRVALVMVVAIIGVWLIYEQVEKRQERIAQEQERQRITELQTITVNGVIFEMIYVKGGTFTMGCTSEQSACWNNESPTHRVMLSDYMIGKYEVTQAQWKAVMGSNPSYFNGDNLPVEKVSWNDVMDFIEKLNAKTGKRYRLPTEAEWEFAARGGNQSNGTMYAGAYSLDNVGWYGENSDYETHPVGQKQPNELGIYDMSGNVREWCSDWYGSYSSSSQTNPKGPSSGSIRMLRGGSWFNGAEKCRVSMRICGTPDNRFGDAGFRLALVP